jgi:hypothetical protein
MWRLFLGQVRGLANTSAVDRRAPNLKEKTSVSQGSLQADVAFRGLESRRHLNDFRGKVLGDFGSNHKHFALPPEKSRS